jgi:hypothetical protein
MAHPHQAIDLTAEAGANPHHVIDLTAEQEEPIVIVDDDDDDDAALQIPAWDDQTRVRLPPPSHTITRCPDLVRLAPDGTPRTGVVVGWMELYMWTDVMEWVDVDLEVAVYVNTEGGVELRLVGEDGGMDDDFFYWPPGDAEPEADPITRKTVFGPKELGRTQWKGFWKVVRERQNLREVKLLARSYIQVKNGGRWADPA